ncbi:hypothetical protein A2379_04635 [Candidatus Amesbacteria bacterium RIFOXYB1_FULL_47_13]|nr:MAG: hypothetical protein A2379_04635 [Candidatus Amesbacteria bacterium RIFOXYB1_FULL_47_13]HBC72766.1 hypothetical protein [Candidatus Amesbacteria bacterium]
MKKDPKILITHILQSIESVEKYSKGLEKERFMIDEEKQDAIIRKLEVIGEAVANLEDKFKQDYPNIPWQDIADMRNRLIHEYFAVDLGLVWEVL